MTSSVLPKVAKRVFISLMNQAAGKIAGQVFLESNSPFHSGIESLDEFLNHRPADFFPFLDSEKELFYQVNRNQLLFLEEELASTGPIIGPPALVSLNNGGTLTVSMIADLPSSHSRLQDYLNLDKRFLVFLQEKSLFYVNRRAIVKVTEHE